MIESYPMRALNYPSDHTVAVVMPCNSFANRQRCMCFFREAATDNRITAFFIDSSLSSWREEFIHLARQTCLRTVVISVYEITDIKPLIRKLHLRTKLLVIDDPKFPKSHPLYIDNEAIGRAAAEFLTTRGYRHLAYVSGNFSTIEDTHSILRLKSFQRAARDAQAEVVGTFRISAWHLASTELKTFLEGLPKPCGIFTYNDIVGRTLLNFCRLNGFAVPDVFAVIGADNDNVVCESAVPSLSSVAIDFSAAGRIACHLILDAPSARKQLAQPFPPKVYERNSTQSTKSYGRIVLLAQALIRQHEGQIKVKELAKLVHVTPRALQLGFENVLGTNPKKAILDYRLNRAKELLATTDHPIAEIADIAGFSVASDLSHRFSERYGLPPTEYRRELLNG